MPTPYDDVIEEIAEFTTRPEAASTERALQTAHLTFLDALGCAFLGLADEDCRRIAEPLFATGFSSPGRVVGTSWASDPVQAAFGTGVLVRWLDFNDTWLALEWGHPSDNLGAILPICDHLSQGAARRGVTPLSLRDVLIALIQAYEIQGVLALGTAFNRHGLDHVALVRIASAAVTTRLLGGGAEDVRRAVSHAWTDGGALRAYRHAPNVTWRKSWAAGDAASRAVQLAYLALRRASAPHSPLTTPRWGFQDALLAGHEVTLPQQLGSYVMENVLLKPWFPAEYHGQTAVELAFGLSADVRDRLPDVQRVEIRTHEAAMRIIDKSGPLDNPADRDHCLQYMVAVGLLHGRLDAQDYSDEAATDPRIDVLRERMVVSEDPAFSASYLEPTERTVASAINVVFTDGRHTGWRELHFPVGHPKRRAEAEPLVLDKFERGCVAALGEHNASAALEQLGSLETCVDLPAHRVVDLLTPLGGSVAPC